MDYLSQSDSQWRVPIYVDTIIFHCLIMIGQSQLFSFLWQFDSPRYFNGSKSLLALISLPIICQKICTILFVVTSFFLFWVLANSVITASVRSTLWSGIVSKLLKLIPLQKRSKFNKVKASVALDFSPIIFYLPFFAIFTIFFPRFDKSRIQRKSVQWSLSTYKQYKYTYLLILSLQLESWLESSLMLPWWPDLELHRCAKFQDYRQ